MLFRFNFAIINIYNIYFEGVKKLLNRILLIILIIIFPSCAYANDYENHWANGYIEKSLSQKIAYGNPDGNFYPDNNITRAEFISLLVNSMMQSGNITSTSLFTSFNDVKPSSWYFPQIVIAEENGIIKGLEDGGFHPDDILTRQDAVVFMCRAYKINPPNDNFFKRYADTYDISGYAKNYFQFSVNNNIIVGYENNTLRPKMPVSRAEALVIIDKFKDISINKSPEFKEGYPKISPTGTVNNITLELKTNMPCSVYYKAVKKENMLSYLTPKKEEINNLLAVISSPDTVILSDILLNSYDEEYTLFLMPVAEDGTIGTIKRLKDVKALAYEHGDGSEENPYIIYNESQLNHIRYCQDNSFKLANDIVLTKEWTPINASGGYFGSLDGDGHTIYNLNISGDNDNTGFFSVLKNGTVKNLAISGNVKGKSNVGLFAGKTDGALFKKCAATGSVKASSNAGGIAGTNNGRIENCLSAVYSVTSAANAGGISGSGNGIILRSVSAVREVTADMYAGCISGINSGGEINSCISANLKTESLLTYNSGRITTNKDGGETFNNYVYEGVQTNSLNVNSDKSNINGMEISWNDIVSKDFYTKNIGPDFFRSWNISQSASFVLPMPDCFKDLDIESGSVPYAPIKIYNSTQLKSVKSECSYILAADINFNSEWKTMEFSGSFDGNSHSISGINGVMFSEISGGAVRNLSIKHSKNTIIAQANYGTIENCTISGEITADSDDIISLGSVAQNNYGTIKNCDSTVNFSISSPSSTIGGIVSQNEGFIDNCSYIGKIYVKSQDNSSSSAGGIAGFNSDGFIYNCSSDADIQIFTESSYAGGICGILGSGEIFKCSSNGSLKTESDKSSSSSYAGGIAAMASSGLIYSCFSTAKITSLSASGYAGGICGYNISSNIQSTYSANTIYQADNKKGEEKIFYSCGICGYNENGFISDNAAINPWIVSGNASKRVCYSDDEFLSNNYAFEDMLPYEKEGAQNGFGMKIKDLSNPEFYYLPVYKGGKLGWSSDMYENDSSAVWTVYYNSSVYKFPLLKGVKNQIYYLTPIEFR